MIRYLKKERGGWPKGYPFCCGLPMEDLAYGDFVCSRCYTGIYGGYVYPWEGGVE